MFSLIKSLRYELQNLNVFLELKFTEFLFPTFLCCMKKKYFELYSQIQSILATADICVGNVEQRTHRKDGLLYKDEEFNISKKDCCKQFFEGIKQMISHFIGLIKILHQNVSRMINGICAKIIDTNFNWYDFWFSHLCFLRS